MAFKKILSSKTDFLLNFHQNFIQKWRKFRSKKSPSYCISICLWVYIQSNEKIKFWGLPCSKRVTAPQSRSVWRFSSFFSGFWHKAQIFCNEMYYKKTGNIRNLQYLYDDTTFMVVNLITRKIQASKV